jgi:hypothetical protein
MADFAEISATGALDADKTELLYQLAMVKISYFLSRFRRLA